MGNTETALLGLIALVVLTLLRAPIGLALGLVGAAGVWYLQGFDVLVYVLQNAPTEAVSKYSLSVLPLFVLMGTASVQVGLSRGLFDAASAFVGHRRGGLASASILACGGFGAICGSSLATVATMSRVAIPEMNARGYRTTFAAATIAAGGTLGILIPPSMPMVIYAFLSEVSLGRLFAAGLLPGVLAMTLYMAAVKLVTWWDPASGPAAERVNLRVRLSQLRKVWGVATLFTVVLGGIFLGVFTPTEGAAVGAGGALLIGFVTRRLTGPIFVQIMAETVLVSAMLLFIVIGISIFDFFVQATQAPAAIGAFFAAHNWPPAVTMTAIIAFLIMLGMFLEAIAIIFIMTPVILPIIVSLGYDPVWFGIIMIMVIEFGLITPPIGMNVFVISKLVPEATTMSIFRAVVPFLGADVVRLVLVMAFPAICLFLPELFYG